MTKQTKQDVQKILYSIQHGEWATVTKYGGQEISGMVVPSNHDVICLRTDYGKRIWIRHSVVMTIVRGTGSPPPAATVAAVNADTRAGNRDGDPNTHAMATADTGEMAGHADTEIDAWSAAIAGSTAGLDAVGGRIGIKRGKHVGATGVILDIAPDGTYTVIVNGHGYDAPATIKIKKGSIYFMVL